MANSAASPKRKRGRPRKNPLPEQSEAQQPSSLFVLEEVEEASPTPEPPEPPPPLVIGPAPSPIKVDEATAGHEYEAPAFDRAFANAHPDMEIARQILARTYLLDFIKRFRPKYTEGWVHIDICRRLERFMRDVEARKSPRMLLMMPPRAGKSEIGSRHFAPWVLGHHPEWEIIAASHTSSLSLSFSRYIRDLMEDPAYLALFNTSLLDPASRNVENWNLQRGGGYLAAGVGTGITGRGAHILLLDDLVKDMEAADSPTIKDNTWEWYGSTAYTRLAPGGGVLGIMCMTGDTPVMMADGSYRRLDALKQSDAIATYAQGSLAATTVAAVRSSGRDSVFKMTMKSGKIVRANQRHPFLTVAPSGELSWTRLKNLTTALRIVTAKVSGGSGAALSVPLRDVLSLQSVAGFATVTTERNDGLTATAPPATQTRSAVATLGLNTVTASLQRTTTPCTPLRVDAAPSAGNPLQRLDPLRIGKTSLASTTAMKPEGLEDCFATTATLESDTLPLSQWHLPPQSTSDFTLDEILSVEGDGEEEVFDVQVDHTENFIANGLVSHNTWWSEDDWAGRIQQVMASGDGDVFEIVRYPAINEEGDEYLLEDDTIVEIRPGEPTPPTIKEFIRPHNTAVHPARYDTEAMLRIKRNLIATGQKRVWQALYQQNPTPDDGLFFTKDMMRYYGALPDRRTSHIYQAWDFAITEGKESDYTVGACIYQDHRDNIYIADIRRFRSDDSIMIVNTILDYYAEYDATCIGFEDGQIWKAMEAFFQRQCEERRLYPSFEVMKPLTDKKARAAPLRGRMQTGKLYFDKNAHWFTELNHEMMRFPAGKHDDQIDALAWAVRLSLQYAKPREVVVAPHLPGWRDKLHSYGSSGDATHMAA